MSDNHAAHFTNALVRHVQRTGQMATLFRTATPLALAARAASWAAPAGALPMLAANMATNMPTNMPGDVAADMPSSPPGPFAAALNQQAAAHPLAGVPVAEPVHGMPTVASAVDQHLVLAPAAVRSRHVVAGAQRAGGVVAAAAAHLARPVGVDLGATEPPGSLSPGRAVQEANAPTSIVQRAGLSEPDQSADQPASDEAGDATWRRLRAIAQAHNTARQVQPAAASPDASPVSQALENAVRSAAERAPAELAPTAGSEALAGLEISMRQPVPPPVEQQLVRRMSAQPAPEPSAAQTGPAPQLTSSAHEALGPVEEPYASATDDWQPPQWAEEDRLAAASPEGDVQMLPLQAAWPVEHTAPASAISSSMLPSGATQTGMAGSLAPDVLAVWPQEELAESLHAVLAPIATAQPTSSPVDIVTPRRLRPSASPQVAQRAPAAAAAPPSDASGLLHTIQEQSEHARQLPAPLAAPASMPLLGDEHTATPPADLWRLIGLEPPAGAEPTTATPSLPPSAVPLSAVPPHVGEHTAAPPTLPPSAKPLSAVPHLEGEHATTPPADLWRLIGLEPPVTAELPVAPLAESPAAGAPGPRPAPAPQPNRQAPAALPIDANNATAGSATYRPGLGIGRNAEQGAGAPAPAGSAAPIAAVAALPAPAKLDLDSLAQAVYAHLKRRLLADRERVRIR